MADMAAMENVRKHNVVDFVRKRSPLFNGRELRGPAWVEGDSVIAALLYKDQIDALAADEPGTFSTTRAPKTSLAVRRIAGVPVEWD